MFRTMLGMAIFMVVLNIIANAYYNNLPGNVVAVSGSGAVAQYEQTFATYETNAEVKVDTSQSTGWILDAVAAVTNFNLIVETIFGGRIIAALFGLPDTFATWINIVQGVIYTIALIMLFGGRSD